MKKTCIARAACGGRSALFVTAARAPLEAGAVASVLLLAATSAGHAAPVDVGAFRQQVAHRFTSQDGLPDRSVLGITVGPHGRIWAATERGLAFHDPDLRASSETQNRRAFQPFPEIGSAAATRVERAGDWLVLVSGRRIHSLRPGPRREGTASPSGPRATWGRAAGLTALAGRATANPEALHLLVADGEGLQLRRLDREPRSIGGPRAPIAALAVSPGGGRMAIADSRGLLVAEPALVLSETTAAPASILWRRLTPRNGARSWAPRDVRALAFDGEDALWLAAPEGLARFRWSNAGVDDGQIPDKWRLFGPEDGLPWNDFTSLAVGPDGDVWAGTSRGLVHLEAGESDSQEPTWEYRQGPRWLPDDRVNDVAIDAQGQVWAATAGGVAWIELRETTLADKARLFSDDIDRYHRRTEYGYVGGVALESPGDRSRFEQRDSDNDGLWTSMYGAAECYAFAVTGDPGHRERARAAFEALRFLGEVTRGGEHPPPHGFVARSILPTSGPDPNVGLYERDLERRRVRDRKWKILQPRWPMSADGRWYWKTDTSSDELDGHYFFYPLYYDLVADEEEKERVRETVAAITDHLIAHDFSLVDHDGESTRWAVFGPRALNHDHDWWEERGLNSLSILSYLRVAKHVTGDSRYDDVARRLIEDHAYAANVRVPKIQSGPGTGNQSDDEMALMGFYNLIRFEGDEGLRSQWAHSFHRYAELVSGERNPLFHFLYAAVAADIRYVDAFEDRVLEPPAGWLQDSIDSLVRYPLDRVAWPLENSHRLDVELLPGSESERPRGRLRRSGKVLPIDERFVEHWNHDPWALDHPGDGRRLADGASFLLPYWLGRYHGFLGD